MLTVFSERLNFHTQQGLVKLYHVCEGLMPLFCQMYRLYLPNFKMKIRTLKYFIFPIKNIIRLKQVKFEDKFLLATIKNSIFLRMW